MTSQSPRIYTYKITFEEVPYYYYGVHKEKKYNEYYMGSPKTHKWCWELYTPKKQILQLFDFTDEGWLEANLVEDRLINPFYQTDKWCLNASCGAKISLECLRNGIKTQQKLSLGLFGLTKEERSKISKINYQNGSGLGGLTLEQRSEAGKIGGAIAGRKNVETGHIQNLGLISGRRNVETGFIQELGKKMGKIHKQNKTGIFSQTPEELSEAGKKGAFKNKENGVAIFALTKEQLSNQGKKTNAQKWECLETGFITNSGNLTKYQKARGIDTSKRKRIS
jgi:general stress protein YciG